MEAREVAYGSRINEASFLQPSHRGLRENTYFKYMPNFYSTRQNIYLSAKTYLQKDNS